MSSLELNQSSKGGGIRGRPARATIRAFVSVAVVTLFMGVPVCPMLFALSPTPADVLNAMYPLHDPIAITDDSEFTYENGVVSGSGNESDPYVVENWEVALDSSSEASAGIMITGTSSHFIVRNVYVQSQTYLVDGIILESVSNGTIEYCVVSGGSVGIGVYGSSSSAVRANDVTDSRLVVSSSHDMEVSANLLMNEGIWINGCVSTVLASNVVFRDWSGFWGGYGIEVSECDRCEVSYNTVSTEHSLGSFGSGLLLDSSTSCTVAGNSFIDKGICLAGSALEHYATHHIDKSNTVQGLPVIYRKNESSIMLTDDEVGQLIVVNSSSVIVRGFSLQDNNMPLLFAFVDGGRVDDCILHNTSNAVIVKHSIGFVIERNTFSEDASVSVTSCSDVIFSYNTYVEGTQGQLSVDGSDRVWIENNAFSASYGQLALAGSTNATIANNTLPLGGLVLYGRSLSQFASHDVPMNNIVGQGLLYYASGAQGVDIDASGASQVIVADSSDITVHSMNGRGENLVQLYYVDNLTVLSSSFSDYRDALTIEYSEAITVQECEFWGGGMLFHIGMSYDLLFYHNDFFGSIGGYSTSGFGNYTVEGEIRWDNGYPSGGNYWMGNLGYDNNSGENQDAPGADGILDTAVDLGSLGIDRYPLTEPFNLEPTGDDQSLFGFDSSMTWVLAVVSVVLLSVALSALLYMRAKPGEPPAGRMADQGPDDQAKR